MITTFYSFKGGVGRTFLALEAAAQLAARGLSVAFWDLDLEAPGLQLHPALAAVQQDLKRGTFDLLEGWKDGKSIGPEDLRRCLLPVAVPDAAQGGKLSFLFPSVLHDDTEYAARLSKLDFEGLFAPDGDGPAFFDRVARVLDGELGYQHVIIDSRTGYTDLGAVCTVGLPDAVVLVAGVSEQNLKGLVRVAAAVQRYEKHDKERTIDLRVVLNKVPNSDQLSARQLGALNARLDGLALTVHHQIGLYPGRFGDDVVPSLLAADGREPDVAEQRAEIAAVVDDLDAMWRARERQVEPAAGLGAAARDKGMPFEQRVADIFRLGGADVVVHDIDVQDRQFDLRVTESTTSGTIVTLVECKDLAKPVGLHDVEKFGRIRETYERTTQTRVQAVLVSRGGFVNSALEVAKQYFVELSTFDDLLLRLFDKSALIESARRQFVGTELERQYVEQSAVLLEGALGARLPAISPRTVQSDGSGDRPAGALLDDWLRAPLPRVTAPRDRSSSDSASGPKSRSRSSNGADASALLHLVERREHWLEPRDPNDNSEARQTGAVFVLLADMGMGKTSFARWLAATMAERAARDPEAPVPLLIDLREMRSSTVQLESMLVQTLAKSSNRKVSSSGLLHVIAAGRMVPIFDGFDEMLAYSDPSRYLSNLAQLLRVADDGGRVIISCRTSFFTSQPDEIRHAVEARTGAPVLAHPTPLYHELMSQTGVTIGYLEPFSKAQIERFLDRAASTHRGVPAVRQALADSSDLDDLSSHPLLLDLLVRTLANSAPTSETTTLNRVEIYERFIQHWIDRDGPKHQVLKGRQWEMGEYLAGLLWDQPGNELDHHRLTEAVAQHFDRGRELALPAQLDAEVRTATFLVRDELGNYRFLHRSFMEYLLARRLRTALLANDRADALGAALDTGRFSREIVEFTKGMAQSVVDGLSASTRLVLALQVPVRITLNAVILCWHLDKDAWRENPPLNPRIILDGATMDGLDLAGIDLSGASIRGATLTRACLDGATLDDADLSGSDLSFSSIQRGSAKRALFDNTKADHLAASHTDFTGGSFRGADLRFADLRQTLLTESIAPAALDGASLIGVKGVAWSLPSTVAPPIPTDPRVLWPISQGGSSELAVHPSGETLATTRFDGSIQIWDLASGDLLRQIAAHGDTIYSLEWSPDGEALATCTMRENEVKLWSHSTGGLLDTIIVTGNPVLLDWSIKGTLACAQLNGTVDFWNNTSDLVIPPLVGSVVASISWSKKDALFATGSFDSIVRVWDMETNALMHDLELDSGSILALAWSEDGKLAVGSSDGEILLWDSQNRTQRSVQTIDSGMIESLAWRFNGDSLAVGTHQGEFFLMPAAGRLDHILSKGSGGQVAWIPDTGKLVVQSATTVSTFDTEDRIERTDFLRHDQPITAIVWGSNRGQLNFVREGSPLQVLDTMTGNVDSISEQPSRHTSSLAVRRSDGALAAVGIDQSVRVWGASGTGAQEFLGHEEWIRTATWSSESGLLATAGDDHSVRIWDADRGECVGVIVGQSETVRSIAWSPDGTVLASGGDDHFVRLWNAESHQQTALSQDFLDPIRSLDWSPDGQFLAVAAGRGVALWRSDLSEKIQLVSAQTRFNSIAWSPDGRSLAGAGNDRAISIWELERTEPVHKLVGHAGAVSSVTWSPDGVLVASIGSDATVRIWDPIAGKLLVTAVPHGNGITFVTPDERVACDGPDDGLWWVEGWGRFRTDDIPERRISVAEALLPLRAVVRSANTLVPSPAAGKAPRSSKRNPTSISPKPKRKGAK